MALATFSDRYAGGNLGTTVTASGTYIPAVVGTSGSGLVHCLRIPFQLTAPAAAAGPSANDLFYLGPLLIGYVFTNYWIDFPAMDSSTGMTAELGDSTTAGKYIASAGKFGQEEDFIIPGTAFTTAGVVSGNAAGFALVAGSLPNFYSAYSTARSETGSNRAIGVADDLIIKFVHAATTYVPSLVIKGYYDLVCAEYPLGTVTTNY